MAGERKVETRQVEGGRWQAKYEDGAPNEFGEGASQQEAEQMLRSKTLQERVDLGNTGAPPPGSLGATQPAGQGTINHAIQVKTDRIVTKKLQQNVTIDDRVVSYVAYRENDPATQSYGEDEQKARVQFLTDEKNRGGQSKAATESVVKANPDDPNKTGPKEVEHDPTTSEHNNPGNG